MIEVGLHADVGRFKLTVKATGDCRHCQQRIRGTDAGASLTSIHHVDLLCKFSSCMCNYMQSLSFTCLIFFAHWTDSQTLRVLDPLPTFVKVSGGATEEALDGH